MGILVMVMSRVNSIPYLAASSPPIVLFQRTLLWRQNRADGIVNQRQLQPRLGFPVTEGVEPAQHLDRPLESVVAALGVHVLLQIAWQRGDDLYLTGRKELWQVHVAWGTENGQVAAVNHMALEPACFCDHPAEVGVHLRAPPVRSSVGISVVASTAMHARAVSRVMISRR